MGICYFFLCKGSTKKYWVQDKRCDLRDLIPPPSFHPTYRHLQPFPCMKTIPPLSLHVVEHFPFLGLVKIFMFWVYRL